MFRALVSLVAILLVFGVPPASGDANVKASKKRRSKSAGPASHVVKKGESLWTISRANGCTLKEITSANGLTREAMIRVGQKLKLPLCKGTSKRKRERSGDSPRRSARTTALRHVVVSGENLGRIAKQYDTSIAAIRARNRLQGNLIRPGQELAITPGKSGRGRPILGQSRGYPHRGQLRGGLQMPRGRHYYRRRPYRAWGTSQLIHHVKRATAVVADRYRVHKLAIGDLSAKKGGHITRHVSHQSGRDIDIGFYFKKKPKGYPKAFKIGTKRNLNMKANWLFIKTLYNTRNQPGGVSKIFLTTGLQKLFYKWAVKRGVSKHLLNKMFQYPKGGGIIRHESGHDDHYHVRFKCPPRDRGCHKD